MAVESPPRHLFRVVGLVVLGVVVLLALGAAGVYGWLRSYSPLGAASTGFAPGPGLAADIEPVLGSGGKPVFIPIYHKGRSFDAAFTLHNSGRFTVNVSGLAPGAGLDPSATGLAPTALFTTDSSTASADPAHLHPFSDLRLDPGDSAIVVVRYGLDCSRSASEATSDSLPLRYDYLSLFKQTERIRLPFAVTLRCSG